MYNLIQNIIYFIPSNNSLLCHFLKDWTKEKWLEYAWIQKHNPWITDDDRQYWKDKIKELT